MVSACIGIGIDWGSSNARAWPVNRGYFAFLEPIRNGP